MKISIIIPTKDRNEILKRTLNCALDSIKNIDAEIIIVNDSKTSSVECPESLKKILIVNNPKQGAASARNLGASKASGDFLLFLDDDILLNEENLLTIIQLHSSRKKEIYLLNWIYPPDLQSNLNQVKLGRFLIKNNLVTMKGWLNSNIWDNEKEFEITSMASYCFPIWKDYFLETGGYNEEFPHAGFEDYDFPKKLSSIGMRFFVYPQSTVYHNECDRKDLRNWLERHKRGATTRQVAVQIGYSELSINYNLLKKISYSIFRHCYPFFLFLYDIMPNNKYFDPATSLIIKILLGTKTYEGYNTSMSKEKKLSPKVKVFNFFRRIFMIRFMENFLLFMIEKKILLDLIHKIIPNPYQYSSKTIRTYSRNGIQLNLNISDYIQHFIYFSLKDDAQEKLFSLIKPGFTIIDVGTNIGFTALNFAKITGENGKVFGFEPDPLNFQICQENLSLNSSKNIEVLNAGLGNKKCQLKLEVRTPDNRGGNRITNNSSSKASFSLVNVITLDEFITEKNIPQVDLIKIDVEGFELKVLTGAEALLRKFKPILFIEIDNDNLLYQNDSAKGLITFVKSLGYKKIVRAEDNLEIDENFNFINTHFDIICYP